MALRLPERPARRARRPHQRRGGVGHYGGGTWGCEFGGGGDARVARNAAVPIPSEKARLEVAPNPSVSETSVRFALSSPGPVTISVVDVTGRLVARLAERPFEAGWHALAWDGRDTRGRCVPAGVYFVRLDAGARHESSKIVRLRR